MASMMCRVFRKQIGFCHKGGCDSDAFAREQYHSLVQQLPLLYIVIILTSITLILNGKEVSPVWLSVYIPSLFTILSGFRLYYWINASKTLDTIGIDRIRHDIKHVAILGPALSLSYSLVAIAIFQYGDAYLQSLIVMLVWITSIVSAQCLSSVPKASIPTVLVSTLPLILVFLLSGDKTLIIFSIALAGLATLIIQMLFNSFRSLADIVSSREILIEKHALAEQAREEASRIAYTDDLTGLPNRRRFRDRLNEVCKAHRQDGAAFAVCIVNIDFFKTINDLYGNNVGDKVLQQIAARLSETVDSEEHIARLGGNEFAIYSERATSSTKVRHFSSMIEKALREPFDASGQSVLLTVSIGFSLFPEHGRTPDLLIERANHAVHAAKSDGRRQSIIFTPQLELGTQKRSKIEQELRQAINRNEIELVYQPIIDLKTGRYASFEALARWRHEEMGNISPDVFITIAEQSGLITQLTNNLLRKAALTARQWPEDVKLSFNLSADQLVRPGAGLVLISILAETGLNPWRLEVELTETSIMRDMERALDTIRNLRDAGINISLDDFGTGQSSLGYIRDIPLSKIKIDKSFIDRICDDKKNRDIVGVIFDMCRSLDLDSVAEGIETVEQLDILLANGAQLGQGYLFSQPVS
ncbi:MAG TPA: EAL domain-containing protein, partial [Rhizobiales bacterium]|nr:EAL domain-containing protein [Hyphomicrobiales bacterium]